MHLIDRIDRWGRLTPDRPVHISAGATITWRELIEQSNALAVELTRRFPGDRRPIAIRGHKEPQMLIGFLACAKSGHPYVPIDASIPTERAEKIIAASGALLALDPQLISSLSTSATPVDPPAGRVQDNDPFYVLFTSGSTGEPKGVVITLACVESFLAWQFKEHEPRDGAEVFLNQAPFSFDVSVMDTYGALTSGGTLVSITREHVANPRRLYEALRGSHVTFWVSTPSFAQMCLVEKTFTQEMLPNLRRFWFCGEILPPDVSAALLDRFPLAQVWNTYGPTEATVATTSVQIDREVLARYPMLPIGYAMTGVDVVCLGEDGELAPDGERGEIIIAGPNVSPGYLGRPDLNAKAFFQWNGKRAYRTGDWGRSHGGLLFFEGRMDSQIKLHGYRIELGDVEANLRAMPGVRDAVVLPVSKSGMVDSLAAFVITAEPTDNEFQAITALKQQLGKKIPTYMVPRKIVFMESFPMNTNGKADRRKLSERLVERA